MRVVRVTTANVMTAVLCEEGSISPIASAACSQRCHVDRAFTFFRWLRCFRADCRGSFTLFAAAKYPKNTFVSVSNSASQREYIMGQAKARGLKNVNVG